MRTHITITLIAVAALALPILPTATATPTCNTFTQTRTVSGATVTATTSSCYDSYVDPCNCYTSQYWSNVTSVTVTSGSQIASASSNSYYQATVYNGVPSDYRYHAYGAGFADTSSYSGAGALAGDGQQSQPGYCYEGAFTNSGVTLPTGTSSYQGGNQNFGNGQPAPCTDRAVQELFP